MSQDLIIDTPAEPSPHPELAEEIAELLHLPVEQLRPLPRCA